MPEMSASDWCSETGRVVLIYTLWVVGILSSITWRDSRLAKGSPPVKTKSQSGVMASIRSMLPADLLQGKTCHIRILAFIDAEGAVVLAVVRDKDRHRGAALPRLIGMFHIDRPFRVKWKIREKMVSKNRVEGLVDQCYILKDFSTEVKSKREIPREKLRKNADTSGKPAQIPPAAPPQWKDAGEGRAVHFPEKML